MMKLNTLKGIINHANELIDDNMSFQALSNNAIFIDLITTLQHNQAKFHNFIADNTNEEQISEICLMINDDMQYTFKRVGYLKQGKDALAKECRFIPGEV